MRNQTLEDVYVAIIQGEHRLEPRPLGSVRRQMAVQLLVATLNPWTLVLFVIQPAVFVAVGMLLSRAAGNAMPDLVYSVIGGGIMGMWSGLVFTSTFDIAGDRYHGTLEMIVGSPTSLATVEAIRTLTNVLAGLVSLVLAFAAAMAVFGYSLGRQRLGRGHLAAAVALRAVVHRRLPRQLPGVVADKSHVRRLPGDAHRLPVRVHVSHPCAAGLVAGCCWLGAHPLGAGSHE